MTTDLTYEAQHGAFVYSNWETTAESSRVMSNVVLDSIHTEGFGGDGIIVAQFNTGPMHVKIVNSTSRANARQQIAVVGGEHIDILNNVIREYGQTGLDIEPLGSDHVSHIRVEQNRFMQGLSLGYNAISAANPRVINASIQNNVMMSRRGAFLNFGGLNSIIANNQQHHYSTHSTAYSYSNGGGTVVDIISGGTDNLIVGNHMRGGYYSGGTRNMFVANRALSSGKGEHFYDEGTDDVWYWNAQVGSSTGGTFWGQVNITSATRPIIIGMQTLGQMVAPDTIKGTMMHGNLWFPNGLRMLQEPVKEIRGISGSTVKMNQFLITVTPGAGTTSALVTFTSKPVRAAWGAGAGATAVSTTLAAAYGNTSITGGSTAGRLTPTWATTTHKYRIAVSNNYGFASAGSILSLTTPVNSTGVVKISVTSLVDSSKFTNGFRIYRLSSNNDTDEYYDVLSTLEVRELGALRADTKTFYDMGSTMLFPMTAGDEWGFSTHIPITVGTTLAFTSLMATDYTGAMQSTTYSVFPGTPTFNAGTIYITSAGKTSMGFTINWTGATAASTDTIPLLFVSS